MQSSKTLDNIIEKIKSSKKSIVMAHQNPDGDTLGSMLALGALLKKCGHVVDHVISDPVPEVYKFLPFTDLVKLPDSRELILKYDLSFSLDCGSIKRLGKAKDLFLDSETSINIDHHISNELFAKINWIEAHATSTGQLIFWLAKEMKANITREIASLLYTTLLTDTGCFSNSNTNAEALHWGSELISLGADHEKIYRKVFLERPFKAVKIFGAALNNVCLIENQNIAWTFVDHETMKSLSATGEDTEDIVDHMMRTKGVKVGVFFREDDNETKVSLRSNIDNFDVSAIAVSMGGGGHKRAAGINIKSPLVQVKNSVLDKVIGEFRKHSEK